MNKRDVLELKSSEFKLKSVLNNFTGTLEDRKIIEETRNILQNMIKKYEENRNDRNNRIRNF